MRVRFTTPSVADDAEPQGQAPSIFWVSSLTTGDRPLDIAAVRETIHKHGLRGSLTNTPNMTIGARGAPSEEQGTMDWRHRAVCRDEDPELFFPVGNSGPALQQIAEAKAVCRRCPVASECLAWALESGQDAGVWGGMSEDERRALKRRNARTRARTGA
jgi:WhiB family redox-sensing transcriptional regulator